MGAINYVLRSLEDHIKKINTSLYDSTKHDIAVILVFFTELFDWDLIRGSLLKRFAVFNEEPPVLSPNGQVVNSTEYSFFPWKRGW